MKLAPLLLAIGDVLAFEATVVPLTLIEWPTAVFNSAVMTSAVSGPGEPPMVPDMAGVPPQQSLPYCVSR